MLGITIKWSKEYSYNEEEGEFTGELRIEVPTDGDEYIGNEFRGTHELLGERLDKYWGERRQGYRYCQVTFRDENLDILRNMIDKELIKSIHLITAIVESNRIKLHDAECWSSSATVSL